MTGNPSSVKKVNIETIPDNNQYLGDMWIGMPLSSTISVIEKFTRTFASRQDAIDWYCTENGYKYVEVKNKDLSILTGNNQTTLVLVHTKNGKIYEK